MESVGCDVALSDTYEKVEFANDTNHTENEEVGGIDWGR